MTAPRPHRRDSTRTETPALVLSRKAVRMRTDPTACAITTLQTLSSREAG